MDADAEAIFDSCCDLAGRLAERGVSRITVLAGGHPRELLAREADLPRIAAEAAVGTMITWEGGAAVRTERGWRELPR